MSIPRNRPIVPPMGIPGTPKLNVKARRYPKGLVTPLSRPLH